MAVNLETISILNDFFESRSGNVISAEKAYLLEARLLPVAQSLGFETLEELAETLRDKSRLVNERLILEAMLTHETSFFRDPHYFTALKDLIHSSWSSTSANRKQVRIWCAACASGQEPFSVAMMAIEDPLMSHERGIEVVATDLSRAMICRAQEGSFQRVEIHRGLTPARRLRYFKRHGDRWLASAEIRDLIRFQTLNLHCDPPPGDHFDIILLRNVLIYLSAESQRNVLTKVAEVMHSDSHLIVGASETLFQHRDLFQRDQSQSVPIYRLAPT